MVVVGRPLERPTTRWSGVPTSGGELVYLADRGLPGREAAAQAKLWVRSAGQRSKPPSALGTIRIAVRREQRAGDPHRHRMMRRAARHGWMRRNSTALPPAATRRGAMRAHDLRGVHAVLEPLGHGDPRDRHPADAVLEHDRRDPAAEPLASVITSPSAA